MVRIFLDYIGEAGIWLCIGFIAQICFFLRFLIQWVVSEKHSQSVIPISFWYLSICGAVGLFSYSLYRRDPVFIAGQSMSLFVYIRNVMLIRRQR
ncbi:MAG: hypothetical protein A2Z72_04165 [Omnitrophica bacterium RBG_13_46_9]|nr:MAG: hypothetical protein A2Z72_04165 [Omnitrophica bacterium RBG_13_46_9]